MKFNKKARVAAGMLGLAFCAAAGTVGKSTPAGFTDDFAAACAEAAKSGVRDPHALSQIVRRTIGRWVNQSLRRRPMIVPLVIEA